MTYQFVDGNIEIFREDSATIPLTFDTDITGATVYLTASSQLRGDSATVITPVLQVSQSVHDDPTNGVTHIEITPTDSDIEAAQYYLDIRIEFSPTIKHVVYPAIPNNPVYLIVLDHPKED